MGEGEENKEKEMIDFTEINAGLNTLEQLRQNLMQIAKENTLKYIKNDIRFTIVNQLNQVVLFNTLNISFFERTVSNKESLSSILTTDSSADHFGIMDGYISMTRLSLVMGLCTVSERYIRRILQELEGKENYGEGIFKVRERLFNIMGIPKESNLWKAQKILFDTRNSFHNNSIVTNENSKDEIIYAFRSHSFKKGFVHNSADFKTLCFILKDLIEFYQTTLDIEQVRNKKYISEELILNFNYNEK